MQAVIRRARKLLEKDRDANKKVQFVGAGEAVRRQEDLIYKTHVTPPKEPATSAAESSAPALDAAFSADQVAALNGKIEWLVDILASEVGQFGRQLERRLLDRM